MNDAAIGNKLEQILQLIHKIVAKIEKNDRSEPPVAPIAERQRHSLQPGDYVQIGIGILLLVTLLYAIRSYNLSDRNGQLQFKSFLYVKVATLGGGEAGHPLLTNLNIENSGDTPARRAKVTGIHIYRFPEAGGSRSGLDKLPANRKDSNLGLIPPKGNSNLTVTMDNASIDDMRNAQYSEVIWGSINYFDVFGKSHETQFCQESAIYVPPTDGKPEEFLFGSCKDHNCDDEDCPVTK